jgi:predicted site-specific integrase-resolvase
MAALARFIPLSEAARRMRVSVKETRAMISSGKIQGGVLPDGEMVVRESTIPTKYFPKKEDLPEYKKHAKLKGMTIWISEAARKYDIPNPTITRWVKAGIITTLGWDRNKRLINEQDVAYCAEIYTKHKGQGKWIFNDDGTPRQNGILTA